MLNKQIKEKIFMNTIKIGMNQIGNKYYLLMNQRYAQNNKMNTYE